MAILKIFLGINIAALIFLATYLTVGFLQYRKNKKEVVYVDYIKFDKRV